MHYQGKDLSSLSLWDLGKIETSLKEALAKREEASKHPKFEKMKFPPPNPNFLNLMQAVEEEIRKKQNV